MLGAQAQPYYGMDNNYDKKSYGKNVNVKSIKCKNINVNVNGLELNVLPQALRTLLTGGEADDNAYAYGGGNGNYGSASSSSDNDFKIICINNNNNAVIEEPIPPGPTTANLNVAKLVTCQQEDRNGLVPSIQQISLDCDDLLNIITEDQFN